MRYPKVGDRYRIVADDSKYSQWIPYPRTITQVDELRAGDNPFMRQIHYRCDNGETFSRSFTNVSNAVRTGEWLLVQTYSPIVALPVGV